MKLPLYTIILTSILGLCAGIVLIVVTHKTNRSVKDPKVFPMALEKTFAMIKPDAVKAGNVGKIISMIEQNGFNILRMEKTKIPLEKVERFYAVHKEKPFYGELVEYITSGPIVVMALEKEGAIAAWRELMGATDPAHAAPGTIRQQFGTNVGINAVHGSDAPETAETELGLFFPDL